MAKRFRNTLVVGISSTALFDLGEVDREFRKASAVDKREAIEAYRQKVRSQENEPLDAGPGMPLVRALLGLNRFTPPGEEALVEVVVISRNDPDTGLRVLNAVRKAELPITRSAFCAGHVRASVLKAFAVDLLLTTDPQSAQEAIDSKICAAGIIQGTPRTASDDQTVRIAFDGDAVLFSGDSEYVFQSKGKEAFYRNEHEAENIPLSDGPYAKLARKLAQLRRRLPQNLEEPPMRIALVTAREAPADIRVIRTLREWGVHFDEAYFLGGLDKTPFLESFGAHIFFDDSDSHVRAAADSVPSGLVPTDSQSPLYPYRAAREGKGADGVVEELPRAAERKASS